MLPPPRPPHPPNPPAPPTPHPPNPPGAPGGQEGGGGGGGGAECAADAVGGPLLGCCSREPRRRPELLVWRLPCAPHEALPQDSLFDNRYYSCC